MKKVAVIIYPGFCLFEFSTALENLALSKQCAIDVFGEKVGPVRSEEGLLAVAEYPLDTLLVENYDALLLTGFDDDDVAIIKNEQFLSIIQEFHRQNKVIAAISAAPVFLLKAGVLDGKQFMCAIPKFALCQLGFPQKELIHGLDWEEAKTMYPDLRFIRDGNIITAMAYGYQEWGLEISRMLNLPVRPTTFGIK